MTNIKSSLSCGLQAAVTVLPLALAMYACSPFGMGGIIILCTAACLLFPFCGLRPSYAGFALIFACHALFGGTAALLAMGIGGILLFLLHKTDKLRFLAYSPAVGGVTLALALFFTVMQTTLYFGIGATGNSVTEMIRSYVSLGFHGNWRGVLYGTITLVIMVTYPRKFKKLCQRIPAPFWSILFTTLLNLWLNPKAETTAIAELGVFSAVPAFAWQNASLTPPGSFGAVLFGAALFFVLVFQVNQAETETDKKALFTGGACLAGGLCCGLPLAPDNRKAPRAKEAVFSVLFSLLFLCLLAALGLPLLAHRIPIPTLAVILIVGAWQRVDWHSLKIAFTSGVKGIFSLVVVVAAALLVNPAVGVLAAVVCGILFRQ